MNYHNITKNDMKNGPGLRVVLWLAGCDHHCKGCHNKVTWDPNDGILFDEAAKEELFKYLDQDHISGLTLSRGDPLHIANAVDVLNLLSEVKEKFPNKTIWLYTGYTIEYIQQNKLLSDVLQYIDVLVDGEFVEELKDVNYHWAGSTNQRVINIKETLKKGSIIVYENTNI
jgi:anaerobic ribonucleoside-triphosphate reductase activating protein